MKHGDKVRQRILQAGAEMWSRGERPTASAIATECDLSQPAVCYHFNSTWRLQDAIAEYAVRNGHSRLIVQLIAQNHHAVAHLTPLEVRHYLNDVYT